MHIGITGAFSYSGKYITKKLIEQNHQITTLTNHPSDPAIFESKINIHTLDFSNPQELANKLEGIDVFINTYWVRFNHKKFTHKEAVKNTKILFDACKKAGVKRIIHVSITNPSMKSESSYFSGKAILEEYLKTLELSYSIIRPAVLFGYEDILINNIAWGLRKFPFFGIFGKGDYKLQPIHVDDFATLIVNQCEFKENQTIDAIGPETYTYNDLVIKIKETINVKRTILFLPPRLAWVITIIAGFILKDVLITWDEINELQQNRLITNSMPQGNIKISEWAESNKLTLGLKYQNELKRR
ncbi:MAG: epimerase [Planctomycetota bacterium]|nr:MAG: epimerase [Planctomycetota bacterium]